MKKIFEKNKRNEEDESSIFLLNPELESSENSIQPMSEDEESQASIDEMSEFNRFKI